MFASIISLIEKNTAASQFILLLTLLAGLGTNYATLQTVNSFEESQYNYSYQLVSYSLANLSSKEDVIKQVRKWDQDRWGAQITAINILCRGPGKIRLEEMLGQQLTTDTCRVAM